MNEPFPSFPDFLAEEYAPVKRLSASRLCETFLVYDRACGRKAIVKRALRDDGLLENEYRVCTQLAGEGLPVCYRLARDGDVLCLVREYVEGQTLSEVLRDRGTLGAPEALRVMIDLCRVLRRFHGHQPPFVHRDIKAENIVLRPDGHCSLIDTGTVRLYDEAASRDTQVLGTPVISPPEQYGYRQTDPRSDVYALGVLLHQLTTGSVDLTRKNPNKELAALIERCTRFDPVRRYANASAVKAACELALHKDLRRAPAVLGVAGAAVLAAALCLSAWNGRLPSVPAGGSVPSGAPAGAVSAAPPAAPEQGEDEPYTFASKEIEAAVCAKLGKEPGDVTRADLGQIRSLLLFGDRVWDQEPQLSANGETLRLNGEVMTGHGTVSTLEDVASMPNLRVLALCAQQISDLTPLAGTGVTRLVLHDNRIGDLTPLAQCPLLQELYIGFNPVADFSPLARCPRLEAVYAGATHVYDASAFAEIPALSLLELGACPRLGSLEALVGSATLQYLTLQPVSSEQLEQIGRMTALRGLYLWEITGLSDLRPLAALENLQFLFLDTRELVSLEGVQKLTSLQSFGLFRSQVTDLTPLTALPKLNALNVTGLLPQSWEPLTQIDGLASIECDAGQREVLESLLPGVTLTVSP